MSPILLDHDLCLKYKNRLSDFYFSNMQSCCFMDSFTYKEAVEKIEGMIEHVANGTAMVFGMFDKEVLIGFVWAYEHPYREETRVYVNEIHVDEAYRGKGIGRELMRAVENMAKESGYRAMYIHAEGDNERAIRLYQHEGYTIERVQLRKEL